MFQAYYFAIFFLHRVLHSSHLVSDHFHVVVTDPLVALEGIRPDPALGVLYHVVALGVDLVADLVVGQEARCSSELSGAPLGSGRVEPGVGYVVDCEGLDKVAVNWQEEGVK